MNGIITWFNGLDANSAATLLCLAIEIAAGSILGVALVLQGRRGRLRKQERTLDRIDSRVSSLETTTLQLRAELQAIRAAAEAQLVETKRFNAETRTWDGKLQDRWTKTFRVPTQG